ncbi:MULTISPECIES: CBS domain-containing protein [unclassified Pseudomonas]|uniref:GHMP family kinase ATP-binding protein n=1 Tax=unclassified Pseudomonas TaxID=196821 RepID=UPI0024475068|nr:MULTISPECIES: CBS domain-containing protein [unclassified Pseudomonas]MDH0893161.1 CBS domain-containing protein [Pseudomonas sp. GD03875]MDH1063018.1 CBS domain-containing protein [Pseudomonas sp. GD03985]
MSLLVQTLSIGEGQSILDAVKCIEAGDLQIAFVVAEDRRLLGVVTNGDVRRHLLQGGHTDLPVTACMNRQFRAVQADATREELLKVFDLGYNAIPGVDEQGRLVEVYTRLMAASAEVPVLARARAPVRMSFCGGGADLTYFFIDHPAAVLSCTVGLYAHATLVPRDDEQIRIFSEDLGSEEHYASIAELLVAADKSLLATIVAVIKPKYGFDLYLRSDFPVGSGLGGSSAATTATIAAFNELRQDRWSTYEIAELAFQAERLCFGIAGGWQDQYASAFGGFNLIEFENQRNLVHPIRLEDAIRNELESCLVLCDTGISHDSGRLHELQREEIEAESSQTELLSASVTLCRRMHRYLIRGELRDFGKCLDEAWQLKKRFSSAISHGRLDDIYDAALAAGSLGGKLLGAGGGGFFLFYVQPQHRQRVVQTVRTLGCHTQNFRFESCGVTSWRMKIQ